MQYIEMRIIARLPVTDLANYEAATIEEAARNQDLWYRVEIVSLSELLDDSDVHAVHFIGVETEA